MTWTLESELCKITKQADIADAVYTLGMTSSRTEQFELIADNKEWIRGGAETYLYRFGIVLSDTKKLDLLIKACVAFSPGTDLSKILADWIDRRNLLASNGIETPTLYGWGEGVLIEQFIPHDLNSRFAEAPENVPVLLDNLVGYAAALSRLGFAPVSPFHDLRSSGTDVVVVDFGQDLGPPGVADQPRKTIFDMLIAYVSSLKIPLDDNIEDSLRGKFAAQRGEFLH